MRTLGEFMGVFMTLWAILLFRGFSPWSYGKFIPEDFEGKLLTLLKVVNYIHDRPLQMNADATLSITIVEANLEAALLHENMRHVENKYRSTLESILKLCESTRRRLLANIIPESEDVQLLHETLNYPVLWIRKILWRRGKLEREVTILKLSNRDVRDLVMQGIPEEEESDRCLAEIVRNYMSWNRRIPDLCLDILTNSNVARGYPLTHRLLIVLVARAMKCDEGLPSSKLIHSYCSAILQDLIDIEAAGFPYQTPDLIMEQVLLCGMEGYLEFTGSHYERLILNWSHPSGCFSSFGNKFFKNATRVSRRSSKQTDFGCDSHATGLAAAAISLFIRENLENARASTRA